MERINKKGIFKSMGGNPQELTRTVVFTAILLIVLGALLPTIVSGINSVWSGLTGAGISNGLVNLLNITASGSIIGIGLVAVIFLAVFKVFGGGGGRK